MGVHTRVDCRKTSKSKLTITFNGQPLRNPVVSKHVVDSYLSRLSESYIVNVAHESPLPIGAGYGTSGAGAMGLSLALNRALGEPLSKREAGLVAHTAEVDSKTGLGTVASVVKGGFIARTRPGAPSVGQVVRLPFTRNEKVISLPFSSIPTPSVLASRDLRQRINACGKGLLRRLLNEPSTEKFLTLSRHFTECLDLVTPRLRKFLQRMDRQGARFSMMMIGEGAFTIAHESDVDRLEQNLIAANLSPISSSISRKGAELL